MFRQFRSRPVLYYSFILTTQHVTAILFIDYSRITVLRDYGENSVQY